MVTFGATNDSGAFFWRAIGEEVLSFEFELFSAAIFRLIKWEAKEIFPGIVLEVLKCLVSEDGPESMMRTQNFFPLLSNASSSGHLAEMRMWARLSHSFAEDIFTVAVQHFDRNRCENIIQLEHVEK